MRRENDPKFDTLIKSFLEHIGQCMHFFALKVLPETESATLKDVSDLDLTDISPAEDRSWPSCYLHVSHHSDAGLTVSSLQAIPQLNHQSQVDCAARTQAWIELSEHVEDPNDLGEISSPDSSQVTVVGIHKDSEEFPQENPAWDINTQSEAENVVTNQDLEPVIPSLHFDLGVHLGNSPSLGSGLFVGRQSLLDAMEDILQSRNPSADRRRVVLCGLGGVGKTQLAIAYAEQYCSFYNSVFWLNAASEDAVKQSLVLMASQISRERQVQSSEVDHLLSEVLRWLSFPSNNQYLLVFDGYDDPSSFDLLKYCPDNASGRVIVTTRVYDRVLGQQLLIPALDHIERRVTNS